MLVVDGDDLEVADSKNGSHVWLVEDLHNVLHHRLGVTSKRPILVTFLNFTAVLAVQLQAPLLEFLGRSSEFGRSQPAPSLLGVEMHGAAVLIEHDPAVRPLLGTDVLCVEAWAVAGVLKSFHKKSLGDQT